ncbi:MAG TPA: LuxR C-terminal-related transcriptional regulator [Thermomicrobiales bacterium]|nr:LuxR C-terminal-related transcriptional regulator [Thermomicrobiales bacterium]
MADAAALTLPGVLPVPRTRLIGRDAEVASARALLLDEAVPLLTLTGPGGVGKTRLALAVAHDVADHFPGGVLWVDLAPLRDPSLVSSAVAALALPLATDQPIEQQLIRRLRSQQALALFDNCEHLLPAVAALVAALLAGCPALQALVTGRTPLHIRGEQLLPVEPLSLPAPDAALSPTDLAQQAAAALFVDRVRAVRPGFAVTADNMAAIAALCRQLDGLPLAIELAAVRLRLLSVDMLLAQMRDRLRLLRDGPRDLPVRQQTLHATIAWSYGLLAPAEQALFRRLAVFVGGWTLDAAAAVCEISSPQTFDRIAALVNQSLVARHAPAPGDEPRFTMLETIREYGLDQMATHNEDAAVRDCHAAWCLHIAEQDMPAPWADPRPGWMARMTVELANIRAAVDWLEERERVAPLLRLATATMQHALWHGPLPEGQQRLQRALALADDRCPELRAKALWALGALTWDEQQDLAAATTATEAALSLFRALADPVGIVYALIVLGGIATDLGELDRGLALLEEALALSAPGRPPREFILAILGSIAAFQGDDDRAEALLTESIALERASSAEWTASPMEPFLAEIAHRRGDAARAAGMLLETLERNPNRLMRATLTRCLEGAASLAATTGAPKRAARLLGAAATLRERIGRPLDRPLRPAYDRVVAAVRAQLGDASNAAGWDEGLALSEAEAVDEAAAVLAAIAAGRPAPLLDEPAAPDAPRPASGPPSFTLTRREREILELLGQRWTDPEIAAHLFLSPRTVNNHVSNILGKLGVANRREAAVLAVRRGSI